ncbi:MAG TPA: helix-turn-helix transcriptional regulator [Pseudonocardiaceae bacterium]|jgi:transcriptional regulator with XRE-family HTH domain|nr:helix-turn-helix transcriptional regulator [Pseudonocardiaceae bacterium]
MPKPAGATIRTLRQQRGIKVREFARKVRIGRSTAYNIEIGQSTSIEVLYRMANELGVDVDTLIDTSDAPAVAS